MRFCVHFRGVAEEADTDLETDRLLGQQRTDDQGFYDDKVGEVFFLCLDACGVVILINGRWCLLAKQTEGVWCRTPARG